MIHVRGEKLERWCQLRLELTHQKIVMDYYNRIDGDQSYIDERPVRFRDGEARVQLLVSGTIMQVYVDDVALTTRCYSAQSGLIGVFAEYGTVSCVEPRGRGK